MGVWQILPFWLAFIIGLRWVWVYVATYVWCLNCLMPDFSLFFCRSRETLPTTEKLGIARNTSSHQVSCACVLVKKKTEMETGILSKGKVPIYPGLLPGVHVPAGNLWMHHLWAISLLWFQFFGYKCSCLMALDVGVVGHFLTLQQICESPLLDGQPHPWCGFLFLRRLCIGAQMVSQATRPLLYPPPPLMPPPCRPSTYFGPKSKPPRDMPPPRKVPPPLLRHPPLICQPPVHWHAIPTPLGAVYGDGWRQQSTLAFGAKSLVSFTLVSCSLHCLRLSPNLTQWPLMFASESASVPKYGFTGWDLTLTIWTLDDRDLDNKKAKSAQTPRGRVRRFYSNSPTSGCRVLYGAQYCIVHLTVLYGAQYYMVHLTVECTVLYGAQYCIGLKSCFGIS